MTDLVFGLKKKKNYTTALKVFLTYIYFCQYLLLEKYKILAEKLAYCITIKSKV